MLYINLYKVLIFQLPKQKFFHDIYEKKIKFQLIKFKLLYLLFDITNSLQCICYDMYAIFFHKS